MLSMAIERAAELYDYLVEMSVHETDVARRQREETEALPSPMHISQEQAQFFSFLLPLIGAKKALEVGTFTGTSALAVASALPPDGRLICCDVDEEWTNIGRRYWAEAGVAEKIDLRLKPGLETLDELIDAGESGSFDFVFIDADKTNYDNYYERALTLLRTNGVVAIDNVLWSGAVIEKDKTDESTEAIRTLNKKIRDDKRVGACMMFIGDGMTVARKIV